MIVTITLNKKPALLIILIISLQISFAFASVPAPPLNIHFAKQNSHSVEVTWDGMEGIKYEVRYRIADENDWIIQETGFNAVIQINSLKSNTKYEVQVRAIDNHEKSEWTPSGSFESKPPPNGPNMLIIYLDDSRTIVWRNR
jgi:hypothetical protein